MQYLRFEDLPIWKDSRIIVNKIYLLIETKNQLNRDYSLSDQLKRCAYSIMLNIAEGFERSSNKEFSNFLNIAKGSAGEVRCILYILYDRGIINKLEFDLYSKLLVDISQRISNFRKYLIKTHKK